MIETRVGVFGTKGQDELLGQPRESTRRSKARSRSDEALELAFRDIADPAGYVPREATELALQQLETCVVESRRPAGLKAGPGMGKSILLHVLAQRLADRCRCVFLPYGSLSLQDLCAWVLGRMGEPKTSAPIEGLLSSARRLHGQGRTLVVLIDDASGLALQEARELCRLWTEADGALQLVLTSPDDARGDGVFAALGPEVCPVRLRRPMAFEETRDFVRSRLSQAGVPKVTQNRFDRACVEWIHSQSGGIPRLVKRLGQSVLVDQPPHVRPSWHQNHDWLGAPLDELSPVARKP